MKPLIEQFEGYALCALVGLFLLCHRLNLFREKAADRRFPARGKDASLANRFPIQTHRYVLSIASTPASHRLSLMCNTCST
ncbi:MAG: hypothetical protein ACRD5G_01170 [Candidatus Acidiferrales bacterium]